MRRYLEPQPRAAMGDGKLWLVAHYEGARKGQVGGVYWDGGIANQGAPLTTAQLMRLRGSRVCWWAWELGAKIEFSEGKQPVAYVDEPDEPTEKPKAAGKRGKKDANGE